MTNLIMSPSVLKHSQARQTRMSLRVTKCHRVVIFDRAYLRACGRYGCNSNSYKTMLWGPTITSLTFGDHTPFSFYDAISGDAKICSVGQYKVSNYQISLTFHCGIELSTPLAPGGRVNPIPNLVLSPSVLERSQAR